MDALFDHPFGRFALPLYQHASLQENSLRLQDDFGVDVNLLLWVSWLDQQQLLVDESLWCNVLNRSADYQRWIGKCRWLRRKCRTCQHLYRVLKQIELRAEAREMQWLDSLSTDLQQAQQPGQMTQRYFTVVDCLELLPEWRTTVAAVLAAADTKKP